MWTPRTNICKRRVNDTQNAASRDFNSEKKCNNYAVVPLHPWNGDYSNDHNNRLSNFEPNFDEHQEGSSSYHSPSNRRRFASTRIYPPRPSRHRSATPHSRMNNYHGNMQNRQEWSGIESSVTYQLGSKALDIHRRSRSTQRALTADQSNYNTLDLVSLTKQIQAEFNRLIKVNIPEVISQHELHMAEQRSIADDLDKDENIRSVAQAKLQESMAQLATFRETFFIQSQNNSIIVEENKHALNVLKREIIRLHTRLPIYACRLEFTKKIQSHQVVILKADTGSGKSTQIVQYLADARLADGGHIICTQHRRLTTQTLASRVANEYGCRMSEEVGYHVDGFRPQVSAQTRICFVTDTVLLEKYQADPLLRDYAVVVIDDAHERCVNTDLLFVIMKRCLRQRKDMKLVILSALSDVKLLIDYYDDTCLIEMIRPTYSIDDEYALEDPTNYIDVAVERVLEIHATQPPGDILVFLAGPDEVDRGVQKINRQLKTSGSASVLSLHDQSYEAAIQEVYMPTSAERRKIIFSTNIAETSIAIDGIRYVIDSGMVKETMWDSERNIEVLKIGYVTQNSVNQRRSIAGRSPSGKCYHLYTSDTYKSLDICSKPEILCIQPTRAVLKLKYINTFDNMSTFDWLEAPSSKNLQDAITSLTWLGALKPHTGELTALGRDMAKLDVEPTLAAMILAGKQYNCLDSILAVAGVLSVVHNIWWYGGIEKFSEESNDRTRASLIRDSNIGGDYIGLLRIFLEWNAMQHDKQRRNEWCRTCSLNGQALNAAYEFARKMASKINPQFEVIFPVLSDLNDALIKQILNCICAGFFQHLAISTGTVRTGYKVVNNSSRTVAQVDRSSTLIFAREAPNFVLYYDIFNVNKVNYLTALCPVDINSLPPSWRNTLPSSALNHTLKSYVFNNLGKAMLLSLVGKQLKNVPKLEESLQVTFAVDYAQTMFVIYGQPEQLNNARRQLEQILNQQRKKLRAEIREYEIVGSTRIYLGAGAVPQLVLIKGEFITVLLSHLPASITADEIQRRYKEYGKIRTIDMIQKQQECTSASVTYFEYNSARAAVTHLSHEISDGREILVSPSFTRLSVYTSSQSCYLKALWFMTESEGKGRVSFSQQHAATEAIKIFQNLGYHCELQVNTINPIIKCSWSLVPHIGKAVIYFRTEQATQQALQNPYPFSLHVGPNQKQNNSIHVRNIPKEFDEDNLKAIFNDCIDVHLMRSSNDDKLEMPMETVDNICRIFSMYRSFRSDLVQVQSKINNGKAEAYVQFTEERELHEAIRTMNDKTGFIGVEKLKLTIYEQHKSTSAAKSFHNDMKKSPELIITLSQLPLDVYEEVLDQVLNQHQLADYVNNVFISRKKLPSKRSSSIVSEINDEDMVNQIMLQSLFSSRTDFHSEPDIQICPTTYDGRGIALIIFNDPRDVMMTMNMHKTSIDSNQLQMGQYTLHLVPNIDHTIFINSALARAVSHKTQYTINKMRGDITLSNVTLRKKVIMKDEEEISSIIIQGTDIEQINKARDIFENLMKGLPFQFYNPSWVSIVFICLKMMNKYFKRFFQAYDANSALISLKSKE